MTSLKHPIEQSLNQTTAPTAPATPTASPTGESPVPRGPDKVRMTFRLRLVTLAVVLLPFAGLVGAISLLWPFGLSWIHLVLLFAGYAVTGLGVTVGYHRYFTHRSFKTSPVMVFLLGAVGSMAAEGPLLWWVATHRQHHQHSDEELDPHSPHAHGSGVWNLLRGFWHAHTGWLLAPTQNVDAARYAPDLMASRTVRFLSKTFPLWALAGMAIPTLIAGLVTGTWIGALLGLLWGGLARVFFVHHITWSVNSVCHIWGTRPFDSHDESRNNALCGVLALGEGWHNNHHAFPTSARHGLEWWQFDISYIAIRAMELVGLVKSVKVPSPERVMERKRAR